MTKKQSASTILLPLIGFLGFQIISHILEIWLRKPFAFGISILSVALLLYIVVPNRKVKFSEWMLSLLAVTVLLISLFYGMPYLLCGKVGAVLTNALVGTILVLVLGLAAKYFLKAKATFIQWIIISLIVSLYFALSAYVDPSELCGGI